MGNLEVGGVLFSRKRTDELGHGGERLPLVLLVENVRSLQNVGALFRLADGMGVAEVALCGITGCPPHRDIHRTALGAEEMVPWRYFASSVEAARAYSVGGYEVVSLEQAHGSVSVDAYRPRGGFGVVLAVGNEVEGVSAALLSESSACVEIPQRGGKHSLNVATAAAIALWEVAKKLSFGV